MISKTALHGIRALVALARLPRGTYAGAESLAHQIQAPPNYLAKLLQLLSRSGLVESRKGVGGGFRLAKDPAEIRLLDVLNPIDSVASWEGCFLGQPICSDEEACPVHDRWAALRNEFLSFVTDTTLAGVVAGDGDSRRFLRPQGD